MFWKNSGMAILNRRSMILLQVRNTRLISRNEEKLLATMTDAQKDLFSRYQDCVREFQAMAECLLFQNSYRLGATILLEILQK